MKRYPDELHAEVMRRVEQHKGEVFTMARGGKFTYSVEGRQVHIHKEGMKPFSFGIGSISRAVEMMPVKSEVELRTVRGHTHLARILMDNRVRGELY